jgi:hypothetical protein
MCEQTSAYHTTQTGPYTRLTTAVTDLCVHIHTHNDMTSSSSKQDGVSTMLTCV